ncbi:yeats family protein [Dendrothele bispora CBS 962.96]|uniref:Protein AF-9 homolog n=1 Tax=Dendrothele bispora (strain CBS 962.96) TaxID=1314807 RepID=A0A4S8LRJ4_DENBC|nr:yeats family protein [Dendrothele bispora CBS 962.96]
MSNADRVRVRGLSIFRPIIYGNTATVLTPKEREALSPQTKDHTHRWTVAVRSAASAPDSDIVGGADDLGYFIKRVSFKLHETYPNSTRNIDKPPFEVTETGWGEFEVQIRITFIPESGEKAMILYHHIKLHPWTLTGEPEIPPLEEALRKGPVHSWQYDEIVFNDPYQNFLNLLMAHPPTLLPKEKRYKPTPFHIANPVSLKEAVNVTSEMGVPEFTMAMEKDEAERLEEAKKKVIAEQEQWKKILIEKNEEYQQLQQMVEE